MPSPARYALYFVPRSETPLAQAGNGWIGATGTQPPLPDGMDEERWREITAEGRRYGFHATLAAPFRLADGTSESALLQETEQFAASIAAANTPGFTVADLRGFLALRPMLPSPELDRLAAACTRFIQPFRAPLSDAEYARRKPQSLTPRQRLMLHRWGYPFVFEEFSFHMTLTQRLNEPERSRCKAHLETLFAPVTRKPVTIEDLCLCIQPAPEQPFAVLARMPLATATGLAQSPIERQTASR